MNDWDRLVLLNLPLRGTDAARTAEGLGRDPRVSRMFRFDSCQRKMWFGFAESDGIPVSAGSAVAYHGLRAYVFALRVATGLESEIAGETDVFGQLKQSWRAFEGLNPAASRGLAPWVRKLFEDTKEIRARHLQNVGGASYGSLTRAMLSPKPGDRILIVGAGAIAASVAPLLTDWELLLWNRSASGAAKLAEALGKGRRARVSVLAPGSDGEAAGWREATHAVLCIPAAGQADRARVAAWRQGGSLRDGKVVHLGRRREQAGPWEKAPGFRCLDDLFALERTRARERPVRLEAAARACEERARLRSLGGPAGLAHGWEDLAVFQVNPGY